MARSAKILLAVTITLVIGAVLSVVTGRTSFVADIESLFPRHVNGSLDGIAIDQANKQLSQRIVFLTGHSNARLARDAFAALQVKLNSVSGLKISGIKDEEIERLMVLHAPAIGALASPADFAMLKNGEGEGLIQRSLTSLYMPASTVNSKLIRQDPLGLYPAFLSSLSEDMGTSEFRAEDGKIYIPLSVSLEEVPSGQKTQDVSLRYIDQVVSELKSEISGLEILHIGAPYYAAKIAAISKFEAGRITTIALVGVILLLFLIFRNLQPVFGSLIIITVGMASGAAATVFIFNSVHLIAVAFGSSLVGVVVDYAIHYYSARRGSETASQTAKRIKSGLMLGMGTSLLGFLALAFSNVDILQQIAVYSAFGIAGAAAGVLYLIPQPQLFCQGTDFPNPSGTWRRRHQAVIVPILFPIICILSVLLIGAALMGIPKPNDTVQSLRVSTPELNKTENLFVQNGGTTHTKLLLVTGKTTEEILQKEEILKDILSDKMGQKSAGSIWGISTLVPSIKRQTEILASSKMLLASTAAGPLKALIPMSSDLTTLITLNKDNWDLLPREVRSLRIQSSDAINQGHLVIVRGVAHSANLDNVIGKLAWVSEVNAANNYSVGLASMRQKATYTLLAGIFVLSLLFVGRLGLVRGVRVIVVPTFAALSALLLSGLLGLDITFFSVMACFLVFALGADYTLFQMAAESDDKDRAYWAVSFSALSTIFVFGLLSFSAIPVLKIMGSVVVIGAIVAWLLAPLVNAEFEGGKSD